MVRNMLEDKFLFRADNMLVTCILFILLVSPGQEDHDGGNFLHTYLEVVSKNINFYLLPSKLLQESTTADNLIFEETFEGEWPLLYAAGLQVATPHGFRVVSDTVFRGKKAGRFELRDSDPMIHNGTRAEIMVTDRANKKERWYSFAVYFPSKSFARDASSEAISQWWQTSGSTQATSLRVREDKLILRTGADPEALKEINLGPLQKDVWLEFVFHFVHSNGADGLIELWRNGDKILTYLGGNMYDTALPYWKVGVYKAKWNKSKSDSKIRILYLDNIRVGNEQAQLGTMLVSDSLPITDQKP